MISNVAFFLVGGEATSTMSGKSRVTSDKGLPFQSPPIVIQASGTMERASDIASVKVSKKSVFCLELYDGGM